MPERPRIGIIGAGAMGTLFGFHLAASCDVTIRDDNPEVADAVERDGLRVNDEPARAVKVARHARDLYGSAMLFLFVKAVDTLQALRAFAGELDPAAPVISLQNGLGNEEAIKTALGGAVAVILGITTESSHTVVAGHVRSSKRGNTVIGSTTASKATSRMVTDLLNASGLQASIVYDMRPHLWGKLVANAAVNALSALLDCNAGEISRDPNAARVAEALADETAAVAAALKINLPFATPWQYVTEVIALGADAKSSMALDLATGHPTEVDHINGAVVAFGRRTATPTPYNDAMVRLIKAREAVLARSRLRLHT
ncbi:MAG: 2-dehydropantoate 2-reductase [Candidatus Eremiobacteraeota bacterium]|nr:2-dehydropantoate 2-reductase [Candidatus Eremiobacteraeota bacterium]MBV9264507.1 2-dehydropantoate 2-reductase [Candidatus Eremiobacteraeota bacterium]